MTAARQRAVTALLAVVLAGLWACGKGAENEQGLPRAVPPVSQDTTPGTAAPGPASMPTTTNPTTPSRPLPTSASSTAVPQERPGSTTTAPEARTRSTPANPRRGPKSVHVVPLTPVRPDKQAGTPGLSGIRVSFLPLQSGPAPGFQLEFSGPDAGVSQLVIRFDADKVVSARPSQGTCLLKGGSFVCDFGTTKPGQPVLVDLTPAPDAKEPAPVVLKVTAEDGTEYEGSFQAPLTIVK